MIKTHVRKARAWSGIMKQTYTVKKGIYAKKIEKTRQDIIVRALKQHNGDITRCAEALGITYATVRVRAIKAGYHLEDMRHYNSGRR